MRNLITGIRRDPKGYLWICTVERLSLFDGSRFTNYTPADGFRAMRSRLEPMKQVAPMLRAHEPLILNWFRAKKEISNGAVEDLNNKI